MSEPKTPKVVVEDQHTAIINGTPCEHQQRLLRYLFNYQQAIYPVTTSGREESSCLVELHCAKCNSEIEASLTHNNLGTMCG